MAAGCSAESSGSPLILRNNERRNIPASGADGDLRGLRLRALPPAHSDLAGSPPSSSLTSLHPIRGPGGKRAPSSNQSDNMQWKASRLVPRLDPPSALASLTAAGVGEGTQSAPASPPRTRDAIGRSGGSGVWSPSLRSGETRTQGREVRWGPNQQQQQWERSLTSIAAGGFIFRCSNPKLPMHAFLKSKVAAKQCATLSSRALTPARGC